MAIGMVLRKFSIADSQFAEIAIRPPAHMSDAESHGAVIPKLRFKMSSFAVASPTAVSAADTPVLSRAESVASSTAPAGDPTLPATRPMAIKLTMGVASADPALGARFGTGYHGDVRRQPLLPPRIALDRTGGLPEHDPLGHVDRDPDPAFEEHVILRWFPRWRNLAKFQEDIAARRVPPVSFRFTDPRTAQIVAYGDRFRAHLLDLPTIIECQRTFDKQRLVKISDISQILVVEEPEDGTGVDVKQAPAYVPSHPPVSSLFVGNRTSSATATDPPYSYPHGLTPPMWHARRRRFRSRIAQHTIEQVEEQLERLLRADADAIRVTYEWREEVPESVPGGDEDEETASQLLSPEYAGTAEFGSPTLAQRADMMGGDDDEDDDFHMMGQAVGLALQDRDEDEVMVAGDGRIQGLSRQERNDEESTGDEGEDDGALSAVEEDVDERDERAVARARVRSEVVDLRQSIEQKLAESRAMPNPMLRARIEQTVDNLQRELAVKEAQLAELKNSVAVDATSMDKAEANDRSEPELYDAEQYEDDLFEDDDDVLDDGEGIGAEDGGFADDMEMLEAIEPSQLAEIEAILFGPDSTEIGQQQGQEAGEDNTSSADLGDEW